MLYLQKKTLQINEMWKMHRVFRSLAAFLERTAFFAGDLSGLFAGIPSLEGILGRFQLHRCRISSLRDSSILLTPMGTR